jgi:hypothetical protein
MMTPMISTMKPLNYKKINFALMVIMEDISSGIDVETIIAIKNIIDPIIIELLCKIVESKKPKT